MVFAVQAVQAPSITLVLPPLVVTVVYNDEKENFACQREAEKDNITHETLVAHAVRYV
jgi:hypothetical protein